MLFGTCVLILLFSSCASANDNKTESDEIFINPGRCTIRYLFKDIIKQQYSCEQVIKKNPICGREIVLVYSDAPPYIFKLPGQDRYGGLLLGLIEESLVQTCCLNCTKLKILPPVGFMDKFWYFGRVDIVLPIEGSFGVRQFFDAPFLPLLAQKSISFIGKTPVHESINILSILFLAISQSWPLFLLALVMTLAAGTIVWALDTWYNKSQFPRNFPHGALEGFWWAYVSMTTVGYGDRTPSSLLARLFAVLWIMIGILFFNMYTATFTSLLNASMEQKIPFVLAGQKVGILNHTSASFIGASKEFCNTKVYPNISDLKEALLKDEIKAVAMEDQTAVYYLQEFSSNDPSIKIQKRIPIEDAALGISTVNPLIAGTLATFFESNRESIQLIVAEGLKNQPIDSEAFVQSQFKNEGKSESSTLHVGFKQVLFGVVAFVGVAILVSVFGIAINMGVQKKKLNDRRRLTIKNKSEETLAKSFTYNNKAYEKR